MRDMEPLDALDLSAAHVIGILGRVRPEQWAAPTPCTQWDVTELTGHLITTMLVYRDLLGGATAQELLEAMRSQRDVVGDDPVETCQAAADVCAAAFRAPGALERIVHHPIGDIPGEYLLGMRISENVIHGFDLARALGVELVVEDEIVAAVYERMAPIAGTGGVSGYFEPPVPVRDDAPLSDRLMALVGR